MSMRKARRGPAGALRPSAPPSTRSAGRGETDAHAVPEIAVCATAVRETRFAPRQPSHCVSLGSLCLDRKTPPLKGRSDPRYHPYSQPRRSDVGHSISRTGRSTPDPLGFDNGASPAAPTFRIAADTTFGQRLPGPFTDRATVDLTARSPRGDRIDSLKVRLAGYSSRSTSIFSCLATVRGPTKGCQPSRRQKRKRANARRSATQALLDGEPTGLGRE